MKYLYAYRLACIALVIASMLVLAATGGKAQFFVASQIWMAAYVILCALEPKP